MRYRSLLITLYATYVVFILMTQVPILARESAMTRVDDTVFDYYLTFNEDGYTEDGQYYVVRNTTALPGTISVVYTTDTNSLMVDAVNVRALKIECRKLFENKAQEVFGINWKDNTNYYKTYFTDHQFPLSVDIDSASSIEITFTDFPYPQRVMLNEEVLQEDTDYIFTQNGKIVMGTLPPGSNDVVIYFRFEQEFDPTRQAPIANFQMTPTLAEVGDPVTFDGSESHGQGGSTVVRYIWDFGDGSVGEAGATITHTYTSVGNYTAGLTVIDDHGLIHTKWKIIKVFEKGTDSDGDGLPDWWELENGLNPTDSADALQDLDGDGLDNLNEYYALSDPRDEDSDHDGLTDKEEVDKGYDPNDDDMDNDGYSDGDEDKAGSDPKKGTENPTNISKETEGGSNLTLIILIVVIIVVLIVVFFIVMKRREEPHEYEVEEIEVAEKVPDKKTVSVKKIKEPKKVDTISVDDILSSIDLEDRKPAVGISRRGKKEEIGAKKLPTKFPSKLPPSKIDFGIDDGPSGIDLGVGKKKDDKKKGGKPPSSDLLSELDIDV